MMIHQTRDSGSLNQLVQELLEQLLQKLPRQRATGATSRVTGVTAANSASASPGKRVNLRGQCIDQLL